MMPIEFDGSNTVIAKDQPEYQPLPALVTDDITISCWKLTWLERIKAVIFGKLWLSQMNFGSPLQPQLPSLNRPFNFKPPKMPQPPGPPPKR